MRFSVGTLIKYRRSVRQMMLFVLLMAFFTLFLLMRTVTESTDALGEDVNKYEPGWMGPWQRRIIAWTGVGLRPTASLSDYLSQRWYLKSNFSQFVDANLLGVFNQLWPEENAQSDRIENQLLFRSLDAGSTNSTIRTIYLPEGFSGWNMDGHGKDFFRSDSCPVSACQLTTDPKTARTADAILFKHRVDASFKRASHPPSQIWLLYLLESPFHTPNFQHARGAINWTATYRLDSDIVAPYEKFVLHDPAVEETAEILDIAGRKSGKGKVAWFVSNCLAANNRLNYARELSKYISVDIFGTCGSKQCGRNKQTSCMDMLKNDYKFYLSFENSNCRWYITEKFWVNALQSDVVPIVMGAPPQDYRAVAPYKSFIHVDHFDGAKSLAAYLDRLDTNATLYNEYFRWRNAGEFINTHFFCRLCSMLHSKYPEKHYDDIDEWWRGPSVCQKK